MEEIRMSRRPLHLALLGALFTLLALPAPAQPAPTAAAPSIPRPPTLLAPGRLTYGVAATFAPFEFMQDGRLAGFDIDFINALAAWDRLQPTPTPMEFNGLIPALQGSRVDIINSAMYITAARSEQVDFVPYLRIGTQIVVRKGNPDRVQGRADLCGRRVAVTLGGIQETYARQDSDRCRTAGRPEVTVMTLPSAQQAALAVRQSRAEAYYESTAGVARITAELADVFEAVGEVFEYNTRIGIAVRKGDTDMAGMLARAIAGTVADGTYARLIAKWNLPAESSIF
jgi:polar amino acid transport system substrate-binding protein